MEGKFWGIQLVPRIQCHQAVSQDEHRRIVANLKFNLKAEIGQFFVIFRKLYFKTETKIIGKFPFTVTQVLTTPFNLILFCC